jgi:hypothetical protein
MNLELLEQLRGKSVRYGSPGAEQNEIIEEVIYEEEQDCVQIIFEDGGFTSLMNQDFNYFLLEGIARYKWGGETILEIIEDTE